MKKTILSTLTVATLVVMASCSSPLSMKKAAKNVAVKCEPETLEIRGNAIDATWSATFPEKYFNKKAGLKLTPVLVYEGGEVAGPAKMLQGEKIYENYEVIAQKSGGQTRQNLKFVYVPGMEKCHLELRAKLLHKNKEYDFDEPYYLADGAIATSMLMSTDGAVAEMKDRYKQYTDRSHEAEIKYEVNRSNVRKSELTKDEIKELKSFVDNAVAGKGKTEYKGMEILSYASPEGKFERNDELSKERGETANQAFGKLYSRNESKPDAGNVTIKSTAEDWEGFRTLVSESNMDDKDLILRVLSMYNEPSVREQEIRNMSKVFTILEKKVLPELRRSVMIANVREYNYSDDELKSLVNANDVDRLDPEALLYAASLYNDDDTKMKIYKKTAEKYDDERAINNYASILMKQGKLDEAKNALTSIKAPTSEIYNNLGVIEMRNGNYDEAAKMFAQSNLPESSYNTAIVDFQKGDYSKVASELKGTGTFNEALALVMTNDLSSAKSVLSNLENTDGKVAYLKAIIAAKQNDGSGVKDNLVNAFSKNSSLRAKALAEPLFKNFKSMF